MNKSSNANDRDNRATAALLYADLLQAGALQALQIFSDEVAEFCEQELQDLQRSHDRLIRDLRRRMRRLNRQIEHGTPTPRLEGLYHNTGVVIPINVLRQLCEATGLQVSGIADPDDAVVIYDGPVMSPRGITGRAAFAYQPQHLEAGVTRLTDDVKFHELQEGAA